MGPGLHLGRISNEATFLYQLWLREFRNGMNEPGSPQLPSECAILAGVARPPAEHAPVSATVAKGSGTAPPA
jgi:hypothetical protein